MSTILPPQGHRPSASAAPFSGLERCGKGAQRSRLLAAGHAMRCAVHVPAAVATSVTEHVLAWVKSQHQVVHLPELRRLADLMMQVRGGYREGKTLVCVWGGI